MNDCCYLCYYFKNDYSEISNTGLCRYWPPSVFSSGDYNQRFPRVKYDDWCGQFKNSETNKDDIKDVE